MKYLRFLCTSTLILFLVLTTEKTVLCGDNNMISVGGSLSFYVIKPDGSLWAWGNNMSGQLGDGTTTHSDTPIKIMEDIVFVSAGASHTMAIQSDGSLWAWGNNRAGQLGDDTTINRLTPIKIMEDVVSVSAGASHTMAIRTDGSLWAWGNNYFGAIGDGTTINRHTPVKIMENVLVASADSHSMAVQTDGSLWAWGTNDAGQIGGDSSTYEGDGHFAHRHTPIKIMDDVIDVSAGGSKTMILKADGSLWVLGTNHMGWISRRDTIRCLYTPVMIMEDVVSISAGCGYLMAIKTDRSLWGWGVGLYDFDWSGDVTTIDRQTPVKIMDDVVAVSSGGNRNFSQTMIITVDGSLFTIGNQRFTDRYGFILLSDLLNPVKIMDGVLLPSGIELVEPLPPPQPIPGSNPEDTAIHLTIGNTTAIVDGEPMELASAPFIGEGGRTMIPVRFIADAMGAVTDWDETTQTVTITHPSTGSINLVVNQALPDGMGTPEIMDGRTFVPVRFIADAMGGTIDWDSATQTVTIII